MKRKATVGLVQRFLRERGGMPAETFVRICKCIARRTLSEPPPSAKPQDIRSGRQRGVNDRETKALEASNLTKN